eukprot:NODE_679_length_4801_cov_0.851978.p4 type:complete len:224 gc:universal NODE_679_length_4801_cov_0.851978:2206-2877(+)
MTSKINSIGILALQGAFEEHKDILIKLKCPNHYVRTSNELWKADGLIIPGGESTAMALIAQTSDLWNELLKYSKERPIYGTCAGLILMAKIVDHQKQNGQSTLGCMDIRVDRNFFGSQIASFGMQLQVNFPKESKSFYAYFIRAPIVEQILSNKVIVLSQLTPETVEKHKKFDGHDLKENQFIIAVQQGNHLATTFHPELANCTMWHEYFINIVINHLSTYGL